MIWHEKRSLSEISRLTGIVDSMGMDPDILKMTTGGGNSPMRNSDVQTDISHGVPSNNRRNRQPSMSPGSRYVYIQKAKKRERALRIWKSTVV